MTGDENEELEKIAKVGTNVGQKGNTNDDEILNDLMNLKFGRESVNRNQRITKKNSTNPRREAARSKAVRRQLKF